jgi:hypothetical protein
MSHFPGQLVPAFAITCGKCKRHTITCIRSQEGGDARTPSEARRALFIAGWKMTRAWGLICATCDRPFVEAARGTDYGMKSWFCGRCKVEVYAVRCPHCGKTEREAR